MLICTNAFLLYVEKIHSTYMNLLVYGIVCLAIIYLGHYLWNFILDKTTVKKIKTTDKQTEKYKLMFDEYQENISAANKEQNAYLPEDEKIEMIAELTSIMRSSYT